MSDAGEMLAAFLFFGLLTVLMMASTPGGCSVVIDGKAHTFEIGTDGSKGDE